MDRRTFIRAAASVVLIGSLVARAQQAQKPYQLGYLGQGQPGGDEAFQVLLNNLKELGYVEGANLIVVSRFAEGRPEKLAPLAAELVKANPQVIAVRSAGIARVVLRHTSTIPVVALHAGTLQAEPSVKSLARPGGNLTGMQLHSPELIGKRLQLLQAIVPDLRRVAILRGVPFEGPGFELYRDATDAAAASSGIRTQYFQFDRPGELPIVFERMAKAQNQALIVWSNPHLNAYRRQIFDLTMRYRMPAIYDVSGYREELLVYTTKMDDVLREAALYLDKIFKGAQPGDLAIGQPTKFHLVVNLNTAKALGLTIPQSLLLRADEVIE